MASNSLLDHPALFVPVPIESNHTNRPWTLITGASSGIGEATVKVCVELGHFVIAGVRQQEDGQRLMDTYGPTCLAIRLDVTQPNHINHALNLIDTLHQEQALGPMAGLINNAGIAVGGPLELIPLERIEEQFNINVIAPIHLIQQCLPYLRQSRGRIINVGSMAGRTAMPYVGPYTASKHALRALGDSLRLELKPWDIKVSTIEPGVIQTPIWNKSLQQTQTQAATNHQANHYYADILATMAGYIGNCQTKGLPAHAVAKVMVHALTHPKPKAHYLVGLDAKCAPVLQFLPTALRDTLIAMKIAQAVRRFQGQPNTAPTLPSPS